MRWPWKTREPDWPDFFVPMATMVRMIDRLHPDWREMRIVRRTDRPEGGVELLINGASRSMTAPTPAETET